MEVPTVNLLLKVEEALMMIPMLLVVGLMALVDEKLQLEVLSKGVDDAQVRFPEPSFLK